MDRIPEGQRGSSDIFLVSGLASIVALAAGYMATGTGEKALADVTAARYLAPMDVFVFSILAANFSAIASRRFPAFKDCSAIFFMVASSSVADVLIRGRRFAWVVYVPCGLAVFFLLHEASLSLCSWITTTVAPLLCRLWIDTVRSLRRMAAERLGREIV